MSISIINIDNIDHIENISRDIDQCHKINIVSRPQNLKTSPRHYSYWRVLDDILTAHYSMNTYDVNYTYNYFMKNHNCTVMNIPLSINQFC